MKILALELSSARGSLASRDGHGAFFFREWPSDRKNSGPFFEYLAEVQKQFGKPDTIIVGLGPGSYAGTRIAISAAIGLSMTGGTGCVPSDEKIKLMGRHGGRPSIRLIGFPSICAIDCDAAEYCVIGDARRQTFFFACIRDNNLAEGPTLMSEAELREKLDKVDRKMSIFASEHLSQFERTEVRYPSAKVLAGLAKDSNRNFTEPPLEPMYLREPHITVPKK
jgi:tRNA threonylcarbamoyl adenosine modification protein YeaZ